MKRILALAAFICSFAYTYTQTYNISNVDRQTITTCSGTFTDSGAGSFNDYGNNEDYTVTVSGCSEGIQVAILEYDGTNCTNHSDCALSDGNNNGSFTLSSTSLTPGQTYSIIVDGNAGSNCDYAINVDPTEVAVVEGSWS